MSPLLITLIIIGWFVVGILSMKTITHLYGTISDDFVVAGVILAPISFIVAFFVVVVVFIRGSN